MNNFLGQLNLTPQERRIVVIIFLVVIVVLNFLFVWPHFSEWASINKQLNETRTKIGDETAIILKDSNPTNGWRKQVDNLVKKERKEGAVTESRPQDPQVQLQNTIRVQERKTGVLVQNYTPGMMRTNDPFFEEHSMTISYESQEAALVSFLYNIGNDPAMIRVSKMNMAPVDNNRYRLRGSITLTANYKKAAPTAIPLAAGVKPATGVKQPAAGKAPVAGTKPATTAAGKSSGPPSPTPPPPVRRPLNLPTAPANAAPGTGKPLPGGLKPPPNAKPIRPAPNAAQ